MRMTEAFKEAWNEINMIAFALMLGTAFQLGAWYFPNPIIISMFIWGVILGTFIHKGDKT